MKTLFTLLMTILVIIAGAASLQFFTKSVYSTSALLTLVAILSIDAVVYMVGNKKVSQ